MAPEMNQTQSIIVYRNPLEQQFWEGGGYLIMIPVCGSLLAAALTFGVLTSFAQRLARRIPFALEAWVNGSIIVASLCVGALTWQWLAI